MPYSSVTQMIGRRVQEARLLLSLCASGDVSADIARTIRGHIFVTLHGMYEQCLSECVYTAIDLANRLAIPVSNMKHGLQLLALLPQFQGYRDCSMERSWLRGTKILAESVSDAPGSLPIVFPADGSFMKPSQLELIWSLFDIPGDPWPDSRLIGRIHEIVDARNDVAHGSLAASERGARLSDSEMLSRIDDIELLCVHMVGQFASQLVKAAGFRR